jgi:hypothetical protein
MKIGMANTAYFNVNANLPGFRLRQRRIYQREWIIFNLLKMVQLHGLHDATSLSKQISQEWACQRFWGTL